MPKKYGKRTSIEIKEDQLKEIEKYLKPGEKLSDFGREAILNILWDRERSKLAEFSGSEMYHKIENQKKDIEDLRHDVDHLNSELNEWRDVAIDMAKKTRDAADKTTKYVKEAMRNQKKLGFPLLKDGDTLHKK